jgi:hypothetical protein
VFVWGGEVQEVVVDVREGGRDWKCGGEMVGRDVVSCGYRLWLVGGGLLRRCDIHFAIFFWFARHLWRTHWVELSSASEVSMRGSPFLYHS